MYKQSIQNRPDSRVWPGIDKKENKTNFIDLFFNESKDKDVPFVVKLVHKIFLIFLVMSVLEFSMNMTHHHLEYLFLALMFVSGVALYLINEKLSSSESKEYIKNETKVQRRYYELGECEELSTEKRLALRIDLVQNYYYKYWNDTLEFYPTENVFLKDEKFFTDAGYRYFSVEHMRENIQNDWGIENAQDFKKTFETLCYYGFHNDSFLDDCLFAPDADEAVKYYSEIAQIPEEKVRSYITPQGDLPVRGIWAYEWWRALYLTRTAYFCEYIDSKTAWEYILRISSYVYYLFDDLEDFYTNYILGTTYWSRDAQRAESKHEMLNLYKTQCDWPQKNLPWERKKVELPRSCARMNAEGIKRKMGGE